VADARPARDPSGSAEEAVLGSRSMSEANKARHGVRTRFQRRFMLAKLCGAGPRSRSGRDHFGSERE